MKKLLSILLLLIVAFVVWYCLTKQTWQKPSVSEPTKTVVESSQQQPETNISSNAVPVEPTSQIANANESTTPLTNALTATNLEQWKAAISGLKKLAGFTLNQHWLVEQPGRKAGLPITLRVGDKAVQYDAVLISVNAENETGQIMRIEMQTPNMNIDETRELGVQLCNMFGRDPSDFLAWCNKVGNHWLDSPLYSSRNIREVDSNETFGFQTLHTYNNDEPWMINFVITSP